MKPSSFQVGLFLNRGILEEGNSFIHGETVEFGKVNNKELREQILAHHRKGQEALKSFNKWMIRKRSLSEPTARRHVARVWDSLVFTYDSEKDKCEPWKIIDDARYNYPMKQAYRAALRYWAMFTEDSELFTELSLRTMKKQSKVKDRPKPATEKLDKKDLKRLLKAVDRLKADPRYPWAYTVLRILILTGVPMNDLLWVNKQRIMSGLANGTLTVYGKAKRQYHVPITFIEDDLKDLGKIPWMWDKIMDLISPTFPFNRRYLVSIRRINQVMATVYTRAKLPKIKQWNYQLRLTAAANFYAKHKNLVAAAQILGTLDVNRAKKTLDI